MGKGKSKKAADLSLADLTITSETPAVGFRVPSTSLRKADFRTTLSFCQNIDIPLDVFGVMSEFLAGDNAVGTLASLNLANRAIREETLPVLYETVLLDNVTNLRIMEVGAKSRSRRGSSTPSALGLL